MGKMGLTGVSLTSAIPGGALFYLLLMAFINSQAGMPTALKAVALLLMVIGLVLAIFPLYLLIFYRSQKVVLAKDRTADGLAAVGGAAAGGAAIGAGALNESFLNEVSGDGDDLVNSGFTSEMLGSPGSEIEGMEDEFGVAEEFGEVESIAEVDDDFFNEDGASTSHEELLTAEFSEDDFSSLAPAEAEADEDDLLTGGATSADEFDFEMFDDEDDDHKK